MSLRNAPESTGRQAGAAHFRRLLLSAVCTLLIGAPALSAPKVRIVEPSSDELLYGPTTVRVEVDGRLEVDRVQFFLDLFPRSVCTVSFPPYVCHFDAGTTFQGRRIRAEALDSEGSVLGEAAVATLAFPAPERVRRRTLNVPVVTRGPRESTYELEGSDLDCRFAGRPCGVVSVAKLSEQTGFPVSLEVLVDVSVSVDTDRSELLQALSTVIDTSPIGVEIATTEFAATYARLNEFTSDKEELRRAMLRLGSGGARTCLVDAMLRSLDRLQAIPGHRLLFVISDGEETCRRGRKDSLSYMDWLYDIVTGSRAVNAPVYIYRVGDLGRIQDSRSSFAGSYEGIARETGGRLFAHGSISTLGAALKTLVEDLETTWLLDLDLPSVIHTDWQRRLSLELTEERGVRLYYPEYWEAESREDTWIAAMSSPDPRARLWAATQLSGSGTARVLRAMVRAFEREPEQLIRDRQVSAILDIGATLLLHGTEVEKRAAVKALEALHSTEPALVDPLRPVLTVFPKTSAPIKLISRVGRLVGD